MPWPEIFSFAGGVIATLISQPLIGKIFLKSNSNRVNQSGASAGGDIVGRDKN